MAQGIAADPNEKVRTCTTCLRTLPVADFRRRKKGTHLRHANCRTCFAAEHRERRKAKKEGRVYDYAKAVIAARRNRHRVRALTEELFRHFGGTQELATVWKATFDKASAAGRHLVASKLLLAIVDLHTLAHQQQGEQQEDLERLTDQEIEHLREQRRRAIAIQLGSDQS